MARTSLDEEGRVQSATARCCAACRHHDLLDHWCCLLNRRLARTGSCCRYCLARPRRSMCHSDCIALDCRCLDAGVHCHCSRCQEVAVAERPAAVAAGSGCRLVLLLCRRGLWLGSCHCVRRLVRESCRCRRQKKTKMDRTSSSSCCYCGELHVVMKREVAHTRMGGNTTHTIG